MEVLDLLDHFNFYPTRIHYCYVGNHEEDTFFIRGENGMNLSDKYLEFISKFGHFEIDNWMYESASTLNIWF